MKILVTDRDKILYTNIDMNLINTELDLKLIHFIQNRESIYKNELQTYIFNDEEKIGYYFIQPIISSTDCLGLIILYNENPIEEEKKTLLKFMSTLIVSKVDIS